jgi:Leucine-rich repeat (LRR) protein
MQTTKMSDKDDREEYEDGEQDEDGSDFTDEEDEAESGDDDDANNSGDNADNAEQKEVDEEELNDNDDEMVASIPSTEDWLRTDVIKQGLSCLQRVDGDYNFTTLALTGRNIITLDGNLAEYAVLSTVDFADNLLQDDKIAALALLPQLVSLNLRRNQLATCTLPPLPSAAAENEEETAEDAPFLVNLRLLHVDENAIERMGALPLSSLATLSVTKNKLQSFEGMAIPAKNVLARVWASGNVITTLAHLPAELGVACTEFDVCNNALESLDGVAALTCVDTLKVADNKLATLNGISALGKLSSLDVSGNELAGLPALLLELRGVAKTLTALNLSGNAALTDELDTDEAASEAEANADVDDADLRLLMRVLSTGRCDHLQLFNGARVTPQHRRLAAKLEASQTAKPPVVATDDESDGDGSELEEEDDY